MISRMRKYSRPVLHHAVLRTTLFERLEGAANVPVTAVLAPPGYGKTTLVSSYIEQLEGVSLWYCVDEGDTDLGSFFHYFTEAVCAATPRRRKLPPIFQPTDAMNLKSFARRYFSIVFQRLGSSFVIVLDDIHESPTPQWGEMLRVAVEELPPSCRIIVMSRQPLPSELARSNVNQEVCFIRKDDLRFNQEELLALASAHDVNGLSNERSEAIQNMMAGWVAGLTLLFSHMRSSDSGSLIPLETKEELYDYFHSEVLRSVAEDVRNVLLTTCFLIDISVENAIELSGDANAGEILKALFNENYFIYRVDDENIAYRFHPLFKSFLLSQCRRDLSKASLEQICGLSVTLMEKEKAVVPAAALLIEMKDWGRLMGFVMRYAQELIELNRIKTLATWLNAFPGEMREQSPWLLFWQGVCLMAREPGEARNQYIQAYALFEKNNEWPGICLSLSGIIDSYFFERDDYNSLDRWIEQVDDLEKRLEEHAPKPIWARLSISVFLAMLHCAPHHPRIEVWLERVKQIPMQVLPPYLRVNKQLSVILYYLWQGDFRNAEVHDALLAQKVNQSEESASRILWQEIHSAYLWCATGDAAEALDVAKEGLRIVEETGLSFWSISMLSHAAASALMLGDNDEATELLERAKNFVDETRRSHLSFYHMLRVVNAYRNHDIDAASYHGEEAVRYADISGIPFFKLAAGFMKAQLCFIKGQFEDALTQVEQLCKAAEKNKNYFHQIESRLLKAVIDHTQGRSQQALSSLKDALLLAKRYMTIPGFWLCEGELAELLADGIREDVETEYVLSIISKRNLLPKVLPYDIEQWPWPIRIRTLGRFEVHINGQPLQSTSRSRPKVLALLKVIVAYGGKKVREELITETIWPDADGDAAHQLFTTTLFRLRKLLGHHDAIVNREGQVSLNERLCWLDTWALNIGVDELLAISRSSSLNPERLGKIYNTLSGYYQGDFLKGEDEWPIVAHYRQNIQAKWVRALYVLADHYLNARQLDEAEQKLTRVIEANGCEEKAYRLLMNLYIDQGRFPDAAAVYDECKKALTAGLGVAPSSETEMIYARIRVKQ